MTVTEPTAKPAVATDLVSRLRQRYPLRSVLLGTAAPIGALLFALLATAVVLKLDGHDAGEVFESMWTYARKPTQTVNIINVAIVYFFSALAVSIGFRMNLFNIGVEGQYAMAALGAAYVGGQISGLWAPLHVTVIVLVAMTVGALWAGIAALLKVTRGVSEVISTIMLNAIAIGLGAFLLHKIGVSENNNIFTKPIGPSGQMPGLEYSGTETRIYGFLVIAVLLAVGTWFVLTRTRFGFFIKATGLNEDAAVASGISARRMTVYGMLISGAIAGLVGLPELLGSTHSYSQTTQAGLGYAGIAIALLGRNSPIGMAIAALLWAFLDVTGGQLDFLEVPKEMTAIMRGVILFAVVIAYELVRRYRLVLQQKDVAKQLRTAS